MMRQRQRRHHDERGFTLLDVLIVVALAGAIVLALSSVAGLRPPAAHMTALQLQAALAETRALAAANAGLGNADGSSTGATLSVVPGPGGTTLSIFRARPIAGYAPPVPERGVPPIFVRAALSVVGQTQRSEPFSILVAGSGYASIAPNYAFDPGRPVLLGADPGCNEAAGVTIAVEAANAYEAHPFACRTAAYNADG